MAVVTEDAVEKLARVCADPYALAREAAAQGQKVAGFMCTYTPEELLYAAGYFPIRVLTWADELQQADSYLQSYACSLARSALDQALSGKLDFLSLMVFPHTCDTLQNLADIWRRNLPATSHLTFATPVWTSSSHAVTFYEKELTRALRFLESETGQLVPDETLWVAIRRYDEHRAAMRRLYAARRANPEAMSAAELVAVVQSSFLMRKEDHLAVVEDLVRCVESAPADSKSRPRVFVAGSVCQTGDYLDAIESAGAVVVDDDLCTGARAFAVEARRDEAPIAALARMYLARRPCPAKHAPSQDPAVGILESARAARADGVVFLLTKFCDPWAFDYPHVRDTLDAAGVPSLMVEIEQHVPTPAQYQNRVAAFVEMLGGSRKGEQR